MVQSFNSWATLNEAYAKGKEILINPVSGKRQKAVWKVQDTSNFMLKLINDPDFIDSNGLLTQTGIDYISTFLSSQPGFVSAIGKLDSAFFTSKMLLYVVLADTERKQKIQFRTVDRAAYPEIPKNVNFISEKNMTYLAPEKSTDLVSEITTKVKSEDTEEQPEEVVQKKETEAEGTTETKKERGNKFFYTMRTNGKLYLMEFGPGGEMIAQIQNEAEPNGVISYENNKLMWITDLDDSAISKKWYTTTKTPLYSDAEITNTQDKTFLSKMFTDAAFRNKTIDEYEAKYGATELNAENLKNMLYFQDGSPIFGGTGNASSGQLTSLLNDFSNTTKPTENSTENNNVV